jgi:hypothetical protein
VAGITHTCMTPCFVALKLVDEAYAALTTSKKLLDVTWGETIFIPYTVTHEHLMDVTHQEKRSIESLMHSGRLSNAGHNETIY